MRINELKCPNCAGSLQLSADGTRKICPYCDAEFIIRPDTSAGIDWENSQESKAIQPPVNPVEIVKPICANSGFDSIYGAVGHSLMGTGKYNNAKKNFGIANGEDAYLIFDATILGSCKKGFAVCTTGFYYSADGSTAFVITWDRFKSVDIVKTKWGLSVGGAEFNTGNDCEKLYSILTDIKNNL